jgi:hypothetical protein
MNLPPQTEPPAIKITIRAMPPDLIRAGEQLMARLVAKNQADKAAKPSKPTQ